MSLGDPDKTEPCERNITILQLLTHTSGLTYDFHMMNGGREWPGKGTSMTEWYEELATRPLAFQPGSKWQYSLATDLCGILVEVCRISVFIDFIWESLRVLLYFRGYRWAPRPLRRNLRNRILFSVVFVLRQVLSGLSFAEFLRRQLFEPEPQPEPQT